MVILTVTKSIFLCLAFSYHPTPIFILPPHKFQSAQVTWVCIFSNKTAFFYISDLCIVFLEDNYKRGRHKLLGIEMEGEADGRATVEPHSHSMGC